jgi:hypothetical protein
MTSFIKLVLTLWAIFIIPNAIVIWQDYKAGN